MAPTNKPELRHLAADTEVLGREVPVDLPRGPSKQTGWITDEQYLDPSSGCIEVTC